MRSRAAALRVLSGRVLRGLGAAGRSLGSASSRERIVAIEALLTLLAVAISMRVRRRSTLARTIDPRRPAPSPGTRPNEAELVCRVAAAVAPYCPLPVRCLGRSLALERMLRRRGIPTNVVVGVRYDEGAIHGHAWVESDGRPLLDSPDVVTRFARVGPAVLDAYTSRNGIVWCRG